MKVSLAKCNSYSSVLKAVERSLESLGGLDKCIPPKSKVLLKPNLLQTKPIEKAVATDPAVIEAVLKLCKKQKCKIYLGDSPGYQTSEQAYKYYGLDKLAVKYNATLVDFKDSKELLYPEGKVMKHFTLPKLLDDIDLIINLPKLKTHGMALYTGAIKNLYGLMFGFKKSALHFTFAKPSLFFGMVVDLYNLVNPQLNIMDAVIGMEGNGPGSGDPRKIGYIISSKNALALDKVATKMINLDHVPMLEIADKINPVKPEIVGDELKVIKDFKQVAHYVSVTFFLPNFLSRYIRKITRSKPIIQDNCIGCGVCVKVCPAHAISIKNKKATINYKKCIRCYCCHEMCPHDAVELKKSLFKRLVKKNIR